MATLRGDARVTTRITDVLTVGARSSYLYRINAMDATVEDGMRLATKAHERRHHFLGPLST